jgi:hypothetical protein
MTTFLDIKFVLDKLENARRVAILVGRQGLKERGEGGKRV